MRGGPTAGQLESRPGEASARRSGSPQLRLYKAVRGQLKDLSKRNHNHSRAAVLFKKMAHRKNKSAPKTEFFKLHSWELGGYSIPFYPPAACKAHAAARAPSRSHSIPARSSAAILSPFIPRRPVRRTPQRELPQGLILSLPGRCAATAATRPLHARPLPSSACAPPWRLVPCNQCGGLY